jgi:hypothetical protein
LGTHWEQGKKQKKILPCPKGKIWTRHEGVLNFFIDYMKLLFSKLLVTIFSSG